MCTPTTFFRSFHCTTTNAVLVKNTTVIIIIFPYALFTTRSGNILSPYPCNRKTSIHMHSYFTSFYNRKQRTSINMLYFIQITNSRHACSNNKCSKLELIHVLNSLTINRNACISNQAFNF